jgi:hypothetical protein
MKQNTFSELRLAARGSSRSRCPRWLLSAVVALSCGSIAFVVRAYNTSSPESRASTVSVLPKLPAARPTSPAVVLSRARELVTTVRFNLFDLGIYPREVHVKKGLLAITIEDYSGGTTGVVVEREAGSAREHVGAVQREGASSSRGKNEIRFGPGRYHVYMLDRPANRALLVVEP